MNISRTNTVLVATIILSIGIVAPTAGGTTTVNPCTYRTVVDHQGYQAHADGDTIESQIDDYQIGTNHADSDIWQSKDGILVQRHDNDLATSTNGTGNVTDRTWDYISTLRTTQHQERIPRLYDSMKLAQFKEPNRGLQFETKWSMNGHAALDHLDSTVRQFDFSSHVTIYSAYLPQLQYLHTIDPDLRLWYKASGSTPPVDQLKGLDGVMLSASDVNRDTVRKYHRAGYDVIRGRVTDNDKTWHNFVRSHADALMTDQALFVIDKCKAHS